MRSRERDGLTEEFDRSSVRRMCAGQDLEQGRFARAVLAQKRMNLGRSDFEVHVLKRPHAGKAFADPRHLENEAPGGAFRRQLRQPRVREGAHGSNAERRRAAQRRGASTINYLSSSRRSPSLMLSLVMAIGVNSVIC